MPVALSPSTSLSSLPDTIVIVFVSRRDIARHDIAIVEACEG
jgi:hypothetical protein